MNQRPQSVYIRQGSISDLWNFKTHIQQLSACISPLNNPDPHFDPKAEDFKLTSASSPAVEARTRDLRKHPTPRPRTRIIKIYQPNRSHVPAFPTCRGATLLAERLTLENLPCSYWTLKVFILIVHSRGRPDLQEASRKTEILMIASLLPGRRRQSEIGIEVPEDPSI